MSALGLFLVVFGALIVVTRAPLIVAPERMRVVALQMMATPARLRVSGVFLAALGIVAAWAGSTQATTIGNVVNSLGVFVIIFGAGIMVPFAKPASKVLSDLFSLLSTSFLRIAGVLAVLIGIWIIYYGAGI